MESGNPPVKYRMAKEERIYPSPKFDRHSNLVQDEEIWRSVTRVSTAGAPWQFRASLYRETETRLQSLASPPRSSQGKWKFLEEANCSQKDDGYRETLRACRDQSSKNDVSRLFFGRTVITRTNSRNCVRLHVRGGRGEKVRGVC